MKVNPGFFLHKFMRFINPPALRDCEIERTSRVGTGSNCIQMRLGRYSYLGKNNSVAYATIGAFCSIASYCAIGGGSHPLDGVSTSPVFYSGGPGWSAHAPQKAANEHREVNIGNDVWIGEAVFICEGVNIGTGAVIGAHSVVTRDVPPYAIVAGAPAKLLRYRFDTQTIEGLLNSQWWEWPVERLKRADFSSAKQFVRSLAERGDSRQ